MQRPSKKPGFCFKIWHPLEKSIWAQKVDDIYIYIFEKDRCEIVFIFLRVQIMNNSVDLLFLFR